MSAGFWTAEKDKHLKKLQAGGLSAKQIGDRLGTTRNAVIGRSARLRGVVFPSQTERQKAQMAVRKQRLRERKRRIDAALAAMRRALASGMERDAAIVLAVGARATYQSIGDELGLSRQRVQQIIAREVGDRKQ
jgi:hypothetical protein